METKTYHFCIYVINLVCTYSENAMCRYIHIAYIYKAIFEKKKKIRRQLSEHKIPYSTAY